MEKYEFSHPLKPTVSVRELKIFDIVYRKDLEDELLSVLKAISPGDGRFKEMSMTQKLIKKLMPLKGIDIKKIVAAPESAVADKNFWIHLYVMGKIEDGFFTDPKNKNFGREMM